MEWQAIDTFTEDHGVHVRGLWVYSSSTKHYTFYSYVGSINDEDGEFYNMDGEDVGWRADDFTHWFPLPSKDPERDWDNSDD